MKKTLKEIMESLLKGETVVIEKGERYGKEVIVSEIFIDNEGNFRHNYFIGNSINDPYDQDIISDYLAFEILKKIIE